MTPAERALERIKEEMARRKLSQRDIAERLGCSQGRVAKMMAGRVKLRVNDLALLAESVGLPLCETIRDRGLEFYAEMSPLELRWLEVFRGKSLDVQRAYLTVFQIQGVAGLQPSRQLTPGATRKVGRPRKSDIRGR